MTISWQILAVIQFASFIAMGVICGTLFAHYVESHNDVTKYSIRRYLLSLSALAVLAVVVLESGSLLSDLKLTSFWIEYLPIVLAIVALVITSSLLLRKKNRNPSE